MVPRSTCRCTPHPHPHLDRKPTREPTPKFVPTWTLPKVLSATSPNGTGVRCAQARPPVRHGAARLRAADEIRSQVPERRRPGRGQRRGRRRLRAASDGPPRRAGLSRAYDRHPHRALRVRPSRVPTGADAGGGVLGVAATVAATVGVVGVAWQHRQRRCWRRFRTACTASSAAPSLTRPVVECAAASGPSSSRRAK